MENIKNLQFCILQPFESIFLVEHDVLYDIRLYGLDLGFECFIFSLIVIFDQKHVKTNYFHSNTSNRWSFNTRIGGAFLLRLCRERILLEFFSK